MDAAIALGLLVLAFLSLAMGLLVVGALVARLAAREGAGLVVRVLVGIACIGVGGLLAFFMGSVALDLGDAVSAMVIGGLLLGVADVVVGVWCFLPASAADGP